MVQRICLVEETTGSIGSQGPMALLWIVELCGGHVLTRMGVGARRVQTVSPWLPLLFAAERGTEGCLGFCFAQFQHVL